MVYASSRRPKGPKATPRSAWNRLVAVWLAVAVVTIHRIGLLYLYAFDG